MRPALILRFLCVGCAPRYRLVWARGGIRVDCNQQARAAAWLCLRQPGQGGQGGDWRLLRAPTRQVSQRLPRAPNALSEEWNSLGGSH